MRTRLEYGPNGNGGHYLRIDGEDVSDKVIADGFRVDAGRALITFVYQDFDLIVVDDNGVTHQAGSLA